MRSFAALPLCASSFAAGSRLQEALDKIMQVAPHTTVTIAHRLTTIKGCNKIAVVKQGSIVEEGTWDELLGIGEGGEDVVSASILLGQHIGLDG